MQIKNIPRRGARGGGGGGGGGREGGPNAPPPSFPKKKRKEKKEKRCFRKNAASTQAMSLIPLQRKGSQIRILQRTNEAFNNAKESEKAKGVPSPHKPCCHSFPFKGGIAGLERARIETEKPSESLQPSVCESRNWRKRRN